MNVTVVICARNAAATIERAVRSAIAQNGPVLLVDDWSTDGTAELARAAGGGTLTIIRPDVHRTLGYARSVGAAAVETRWLQWLDADDELLPGRGGRLMGCAQDRGWDAVWDAAELYDGDRGTRIRSLPMPAFMQCPGSAVRLFERNHTPGPAWPLVRTDFARCIGYDADFPTGDDLDFMLRGLRAGGTFGFVADCGYRQYAYASSLSRDLTRQRRWVSAALRKHDYADIRAHYLDAGIDERVAWWALVSVATFREEWTTALAFLDEASPCGASDVVLEPEGPWPFREAWRRAFHRGTLLLLSGGRDADAACELQRAETIDPTAEGSNNLGVALARLGRRAEAIPRFAAAVTRFPGYADATRNLGAYTPTHITVHPLRRDPSRSEY